MQPSSFLSGGWKRANAASSGVVRRACPASGAQWNVQVVRGKVNGKCLWNACKALSVGLLLMVLGAAMATIGYYADHLSVAQEIRGNYTVRIKNESRGFHLNNLSYAGPIVMGVGGFIVVAACVMTFEARDSAAKVVPARFKLSTSGPPTKASCGYTAHPNRSTHNSLRTSGSQTTNLQYTNHLHSPTDRHALTQSFMNFSRGLAVESQTKGISPQGSISKSPSAPNLVVEHGAEDPNVTQAKTLTHDNLSAKSNRTFAACALLNPSLLHRHALSVDETAAAYRLSHESLHGSGSQGSMALDLHLEYPVTLKVRDRRRNPLRRQQRVDEEERQGQSDTSRRSSHSCSPRMSLRRSHNKEPHLTSLSSEAGETAKEEVISGADHVKTTVKSAVEHISTDLSSSVDKFGDKFKSKHSEVEEAYANTTEDVFIKVNDNMMEVVSEAETVLASEIDNATDDVQETSEMVFEKVSSAKGNILEEARELHQVVDETLEVQDVEDSESSPIPTSVENEPEHHSTTPQEESKE
ncbi:hypothetical protein FQA39_LY06526 [Lamprigera yunnana]|nr:hypothetical protein FQA39_LY06526 [Lamprigera yunnana]